MSFLSSIENEIFEKGERSGKKMLYFFWKHMNRGLINFVNFGFEIIPQWVKIIKFYFENTNFSGFIPRCFNNSYLKNVCESYIAKLV